MEPVVSQLEELYEGSLVVRTVNVFDNSEMADKYALRVVPTQVLEDPEGNLLEKNEGFMSLGEIQQWLDKHGISAKEGD